MWIEQRPIQFTPVQIRQKGEHYVLQNGHTNLELSAREYQYFDQLAHGVSIQQMVKNFVQQGWLVSFREVYRLLDKMVQQHFVVSPEVVGFFTAASGGFTATGMKEIPHYKGQPLADTSALKKLPFFRTLPSDLQQLFIKNAQVVQVPAQTRLCQAGQNGRELFVMLEGQAGVYQPLPENRRQLISVVSSGSVVGEGGFLLGKPRGADVITTMPSLVATIQFSPEIMSMIDAGKAQALQHRFWVLNGLLASEVFAKMPSETLDSLVFAGKVVPMLENSVIVKEGDPGRSFFIVVQGSVAFSKGGKSLRAIGQGGIFGEIALMINGGQRTATATAQRSGLLLEIEMAEFYEVLSSHLLLAKTIEEMAWHRWQTAQS